ncbi:MAG: hypothetical protein AAGF85_11585 [Bacteroidota bacterium]
MKNLFIILLLFAGFMKSPAQINEIEHFYIASPEAKAHFDLFVSEFDIPVEWDYKDYGGFASGGVTLGNVVLEFVGSETPFLGIALEPSQTAEKIIPFLDSAKITHGELSKFPFWSTVTLMDMLPEHIYLFLCDYHDRGFVVSGREESTQKLVKRNGGSLGIIKMDQLTLGVKDPTAYLQELRKLPGVDAQNEILTFSKGPKLVVLEKPTPFFGILAKVHSVEKAKQKLQSLDIPFTINEKRLMIDEQQFGMRITLE